ncbi:hypothetical protein CRG98_034613 [Punica granatum]|uniref:Transposase MuDR plant domain-containing protein n=1 Tax=Punica granatum TaxID=22663 RepID=A0A2I0ILU1_PUNGR|nr:hypothetical protein CRG98_034613 [Punica granatum]
MNHRIVRFYDSNRDSDNHGGEDDEASIGDDSENSKELVDSDWEQTDDLDFMNNIDFEAEWVGLDSQSVEREMKGKNAMRVYEKINQENTKATYDGYKVFNPKLDMDDPKFEIELCFTDTNILRAAIRQHSRVHGRDIKFTKNDRFKKFLENLMKKSNDFIVHWNGDAKFEAEDSYGDRLNVNLRMRTCSCRRWQLNDSEMPPMLPLEHEKLPGRLKKNNRRKQPDEINLGGKKVVDTAKGTQQSVAKLASERTVELTAIAINESEPATHARKKLEGDGSPWLLGELVGRWIAAAALEPCRRPRRGEETVAAGRWVPRDGFVETVDSTVFFAHRQEGWVTAARDGAGAGWRNGRWVGEGAGGWRR